jgi:hypothetical protein
MPDNIKRRGESTAPRAEQDLDMGPHDTIDNSQADTPLVLDDQTEHLCGVTPSGAVVTFSGQLVSPPPAQKFGNPVALKICQSSANPHVSINHGLWQRRI